MGINTKSNFERYCDYGIVFSFCALIYFLPISIALVESFSGMVIFLFAIKKIRTGQFISSLRDAFLAPDNLIGRVLGVYMVAIFLSVLFSHDIKVSAMAFIGKTLQCVFLYLSFIDVFKKKAFIAWFVGVFLVSGLLVATSGFSQHFTGVDFVRGNQMAEGRISSCLRHANDCGVYLLVLILMVGSLLILWKPLRRKLIVKCCLGAFFVFALTCLLWTFSRGAWVGFICSSILFLFLERKSWPLVLTTFLIIYFIFIPSLQTSRNINLISDTQTTSSQSFFSSFFNFKNSERPAKVPQGSLIDRALFWVEESGGTGRGEYWKKAIQIIKTRLWTGVGLNMYSKTSLSFPSQAGGGYAHNCYLQMTAESGLLGLIAFIVLILTLFIKAIRRLRSMQDPFLKAITIGGLCALAGFLVESFFDTTLYSVQLINLMWLVVALVVAAIATDRKLTKHPSSL